MAVAACGGGAATDTTAPRRGARKGTRMSQDYAVWVRGQDSGGKWGAIDVAELGEKEFKRFILNKLVEAGVVFGAEREEPHAPYRLDRPWMDEERNDA